MFKKCSVIFLLVVAWPLATVPATAAGLKVGPAGFAIRNVEPGRLYDVYKESGVQLTVYNDNDTTRAYVLSVHRPSQRGTWETGYLEIPDAAWCRFENSEVTVGPHSQGHADLYLKVPEGDRYYDQHWVATIGVSGKSGAAGIALAVDIRVQIETASKPDATQRPDGALGLRPGLLRLAPAGPGDAAAAKTTIYNNDTKAHTYTIAPLPLDDPARARRYLSATFEPCPDTARLKFPKEIAVAAGGSAEIALEVAVPDSANLAGKKWEAIILIKPEEGLPAFVRCQIETRSQP